MKIEINYEINQPNSHTLAQNLKGNFYKNIAI